MKKTMRKLLIILLVLISATTLFAAEGDETTTSPETSYEDYLKVTTTVGQINEVAFVASGYASDPTKNPRDSELSDVPDASYTDIAEGDGFKFKAAVRTNMKGSTTLTVTVDSPMKGKSYGETYPVTLSSGTSESDAANTPSTKFPVDATDPVTALTLTGKDSDTSKLRAFDYSLALTCPGLKDATADDYSTTLKLTASYI